MVTCEGDPAGVFGAKMQVDLLNDGPVTIIIDMVNRERFGWSDS